MWTHITYTSNWLDVEREKKQTAKKVAINSTNKQCNLFSYFICFVFITQLIKCVRLSFTAIDFGIIQSFQYLPYQIDRYRCKTECSLFLRMKCILCTACVFLVHCAWWTGKYVALFFVVVVEMHGIMRRLTYMENIINTKLTCFYDVLRTMASCA